MAPSAALRGAGGAEVHRRINVRRGAEGGGALQAQRERPAPPSSSKPPPSTIPVPLVAVPQAAAPAAAIPFSVPRAAVPQATPRPGAALSIAPGPISRRPGSSPLKSVAEVGPVADSDTNRLFKNLSQHSGQLPSGGHEPLRMPPPAGPPALSQQTGGASSKLTMSTTASGRPPPIKVNLERMGTKAVSDSWRAETQDDLAREEADAAREYSRLLERSEASAVAVRVPGSLNSKGRSHVLGSRPATAMRPRKLQIPPPPPASPPTMSIKQHRSAALDRAAAAGHPAVPVKASMHQELRYSSNRLDGTTGITERGEPSDRTEAVSSEASSRVSVRFSDVDAMTEAELRAYAKRLQREIMGSQRSSHRHASSNRSRGGGAGGVAAAVALPEPPGIAEGAVSELSSERSTARSLGGFTSVFGSENPSIAPSACSTLRGGPTRRQRDSMLTAEEHAELCVALGSPDPLLSKQLFTISEAEDDGQQGY